MTSRGHLETQEDVLGCHSAWVLGENVSLQTISGWRANNAKHPATCEMVAHSQDYSRNSNSASTEEHRYCLQVLVTLYLQYYLPTSFHAWRTQGQGKEDGLHLHINSCPVSLLLQNC